jgi:hypothetical protein
MKRSQMVQLVGNRRDGSELGLVVMMACEQRLWVVKQLPRRRMVMVSAGAEVLLEVRARISISASDIFGVWDLDIVLGQHWKLGGEQEVFEAGSAS